MKACSAAVAIRPSLRCLIEGRDKLIADEEPLERDERIVDVLTRHDFTLTIYVSHTQLEVSGWTRSSPRREVRDPESIVAAVDGIEAIGHRANSDRPARINRTLLSIFLICVSVFTLVVSMLTVKSPAAAAPVLPISSRPSRSRKLGETWDKPVVMLMKMVCAMLHLTSHNGIPSTAYQRRSARR